MFENNYMSLIIFAPLLGAVINWFFGKRANSEMFSGVVACTAVGISTVVAFMIAFGIGTPHQGALFIPEGKPVLDHIWTWIQVGDFRADFGLGMDRLSGIYVLFVTFVGFLIHVFATGYMHGDKGFYRFFAYLNLFMFSMLTLVLADNYLLMFVGWEGVGLCSYLLIGYYIHKDEARKAAKKAFVMNRIGDWGVLMGVFLIFTMTGSISFFDKTVDGQQVQSVFTWVSSNITIADPFTWGAIVAGGMTSIGVLLFIGATGKSAQIPLLTWLPDAMAGPTPVSALIHAATMVTAGIYLVVRSNAIYQNAPTAMFIIAIIGAATAIFAATIGLAQNDIKKVLAYSTVSQLGYMFLACGVGAYVVAIFHVMTHAFFKALLFLGSGSVIHGMHHEQDMRRMGNLKKYMPITFFTMATGWLAIAGIPIFAGFFSKDEILYKTFAAQGIGSWNYILWAVALVTAVLTAIYMTRLMVMTFWGKERFHQALPDEEHADHDDDDHHEIPADFKPHESPWTMTVPLIVLAFLSTFGGLVGIPYALSSLPVVSSIVGKEANHFETTLKPVIAKMGDKKAQGEEGEVKHFYAAAEGEGGEGAAHHSPEEIAAERWLALFSVLLAAGGIAIGWFMFAGNPLRKMPKLFEKKWYLDEIYNKGIVDPITNFSRKVLWQGFDLGFIDGTINGLGSFVTEIGSLVRRTQVGFVRSYAAIILLGALLVIGYFIYYAFRMIG
ncbi:MAG: NADH-quinone oxidoreductase subunit L [Acidobacteria bacterium]|nr:MAG: NADH-quinone oxidoreductase subunit L [Acidobacteriota bacterium]REK01975.1 MAG: NADH-quinone oxidoreductase subunit L [Acidobacteriota bacterium]REK14932.1 MAG: NADH-quinone oxidoreductase subunit L [Acidobacteriota bacterium]REK45646.1 MAG: NADH-quinone oxidoreductase subunit L [Acidobacteriota bacterium]